MFEQVKALVVSERVRWIPGSRLAGYTGTVVHLGCMWCFVKVDGSEREEYTPIALLESLREYRHE